MERLDLDEKEIAEFLDGLSAGRELPALSGHKARLATGRNGAIAASWGRDGRIEAHAVIAPHGDRYALETAVAPRLEHAEGERQVLDLTLGLVPRDAPFTVWAWRPSQQAALEDMGFVPLRAVVRMRRSLPAAPPRVPDGVELRPWRRGVDDEAIVAINRAAFADHPEQGAMTVDELVAVARVTGTEPDDLVVATIDGAPVGFCWTRPVTPQEGEIHVIAVEPSVTGRGLGRALVLAGLEQIHGRGGRRARLWTDADNGRAVELYRRLGFAQDAVNVEYGP